MRKSVETFTEERIMDETQFLAMGDARQLQQNVEALKARLEQTPEIHKRLLAEIHGEAVDLDEAITECLCNDAGEAGARLLLDLRAEVDVIGKACWDED
jgi:hypothetical protein